jgi:hypothetical protein
MQVIQIIADIEKASRQKLTIGQRQQIISAIHLFKEGVRNVDSNAMQIITRRFLTPQNELLELSQIEQRAADYLRRPLNSEELTFLRQTEAVRKSHIAQLQDGFIKKLIALTRLPFPELEVILKRHHLIA